MRRARPGVASRHFEIVPDAVFDVVFDIVFDIVGMPIIIGIPPHIIMQGMPAAIIRVMASQRSFIMSIDMPSAGIILQTMPSFPISKDIRHIIAAPGIMPMPIMPIICGIIPGIICGIMPIM